MDIHRCRFVDFPPFAINCLAFSHPDSLPSDAYNPAVRLAVGRANGDIEIWNPNRGNWVQETVFRGGKDRSIEGLAWVASHDDDEEEDAAVTPDEWRRRPRRMRLFSFGYSSSVTEWDLATGLPRRESTGNHSDIWCMAVQPAWSPTVVKDGKPVVREGEFKGQNLAIGCADGRIALLSTEDDDLQFSRFIWQNAKSKGRALGMTFKDRNILVVGFADSRIRVFDTRTGHILQTIAVGVGAQPGPKEVLVWAVKSLPNGDIVTGDSTGSLYLWDGKKYSQLQKIQAHDADILDVVSNADGTALYSVGIDRKHCLYELEEVAGGHGQKRFVKKAHNRYHDNDVKAIAAYESKGVSVAVSGGLDSKLVVVPLRERLRQEHLTFSGLPHSQALVSSPQRRLLCSWWDQEVNIWRLKPTGGVVDSAEPPHELLSRIALKGEENIASVDISDDGSLLAVSSAAEVRIFQLRLLKKPDPEEDYLDIDVLRIRKLDLPNSLRSSGARLVKFAPDGKWLAIVRASGPAVAVRFTTEPLSDDEREAGKVPKVQCYPKVFTLPRDSAKARRHEETASAPWIAWDGYLDTINRVCFSQDSRMLAATDLDGRVSSWILAEVQPRTNGASKKLATDSDSESSDASSSDDDAVPNGTTPVQKWKPNASTSTLPRLPAPAILASFRPFPTTPSSSQRNGATPFSPPYHLLLLTSAHQLYEFDLRAGQLTPWSRRNPPAHLPADFARIRHRAIGSQWHAFADGDTVTQRLWLWSHSWLGMLDLSTDFPGPSALELEGGASTPRRKRRESDAGGGEARKRQRAPRAPATGAGDAVRAERLVGLLPTMTVAVGEAGAREVQLLRGGRSREQDEEDGDGAVDLRGLRLGAKGENGAEDARTEEGEETGGELVAARETGATTRWFTFKYRPILGVVRLEGGQVDEEGQTLEEDGAGGPVLEVAVVERPEWDVDMPARMEGPHGK